MCRRQWGSAAGPSRANLEKQSPRAPHGSAGGRGLRGGGAVCPVAESGRKRAVRVISERAWARAFVFGILLESTHAHRTS